MDQKKEKRVRIPLVASHAYVLVNQVIPLNGLPLEVRLERVTVHGGGCGPRSQHNRVMLRFPGMIVDTIVKTYEPDEKRDLGPLLTHLHMFCKFDDASSLRAWLGAMKNRLGDSVWKKTIRNKSIAPFFAEEMTGETRPAVELLLDQVALEKYEKYQKQFDR